MSALLLMMEIFPNLLKAKPQITRTIYVVFVFVAVAVAVVVDVAAAAVVVTDGGREFIVCSVLH